ncbi:MAG: T9SS type A sorting domain-containing protein, partial [Chitinophagales bacterium]
NPVSKILTLELPVFQGENEVVVYDVTGKKMVEFWTLEGRLEVDMSGFGKGVYLVRVRNDEEVGVFRVVR